MIRSDRPPRCEYRHERKLTDGIREFKVQGRAKQMSTNQRPNNELSLSNEKSINEDNLVTLQEMRNNRPRSILKRTIQSKQRSRSTPAAILRDIPVPVISPRPKGELHRTSTASNNNTVTEKSKLQKAINYLQLPDKEANWEMTVEHISNVCPYLFTKIFIIF